MNLTIKLSRMYVLAIFCTIFMSAGPPSSPAGGPNPCANIDCATHPNHPCCQNQIPADGYIFIPIILDLAYSSWKIYKMPTE